MTRYSKLWAALVGALAIGLVEAGVIPAGQEESLTTVLLAFLAAAGVYAAPNRP